MRAWILYGAALAAATISVPAAAQIYDERPATVVPSTSGWDYVRSTAEIPMRDGVKLHTVILVPKGAKDAPILLTRTPYNADGLTSNVSSGSGRGTRRLRQCRRRHRRGRIHPRRPGHPRQIWLAGRLRHEPAARRIRSIPTKVDDSPTLRHHRLAGEACPRVQRAGRHHRHQLRRLCSRWWR